MSKVPCSPFLFHHLSAHPLPVMLFLSDFWLPRMRLPPRSLDDSSLVPFREGFLNLSIWDQILLSGGVCPVHYRMFGSIPGLYPFDAISIPVVPAVTTKNVSRHCQTTLGWGWGGTGGCRTLYSPFSENHCFGKRDSGPYWGNYREWRLIHEVLKGKGGAHAILWLVTFFHSLMAQTKFCFPSDTLLRLLPMPLNQPELYSICCYWVPTYIS